MTADVEQVMALLLEAALELSRACCESRRRRCSWPTSGPMGWSFLWAYWIDDLENGQGNLRSEINLAILADPARARH